MKLKCYIGNYDGLRGGLVLVPNKTQARKVVRTSQRDFDDYWYEWEPAHGLIPVVNAKPLTLYTCLYGRSGKNGPYVQGICGVECNAPDAAAIRSRMKSDSTETNSEIPLNRLVVCAALKHTDGSIICGARHYDDDEIMRQQIVRASNASGWRGAEQGFIDQKGVFLTREEALEVAKAAGQIKRRCGGDSKRLFSENLY